MSSKASGSAEGELQPAPPPAVERNGVRIVDTFAEAFGMRGARVVITAQSPAWARTAALSMTGFATSVIGCKVEAGIEAEIAPDDTPDGRPGISVLLFAFDAEGLGRQLIDRVGQTILTCPTTACFDGLPQSPERVTVGGALRHFGDKYQSSKMLDGQRYWRIPVMEGEFLVQEAFGIQKAIGGGNFLILAKDQAAALAAAEAAVVAMRRVRGVILPFPGGIVRAGRANSVLEIVIDGLDRTAIEDAMRAGLDAACRPGVVEITAGNYGGKLGKHHFHLHQLIG
jgi:formylmethanofuran--tetrahydromethanopterin N-formyltransferase